MGVCCYTTLKYIVMVFNLLYMMMGGVLLATMLWIYLDGANMAPVTKDIDVYNYVVFFIMVVGVIMFIMGFLGCCGACQESQCMLATFFALVLVLFMGQVAAIVWLKTNEARFRDTFTRSLTSSIKKDYGENKVKTTAFDIIQSKLYCCGSVGPTDWAESNFNGADKADSLEIGVSGSDATFKVPESCCVNPNKCDSARKISISVTDNNSIYNEGCSKKLMEQIKNYSYEILGCLLAILLIQVLAMVFSMVLCCTVRRIDHVKA